MTSGEVLDEAAKQAALEVGWALFRIFPSSLFKMYTVDGLEIPFPTTWDVENPINNGIFTISTGAGFLPSTVCIGPRCSNNIEVLCPRMLLLGDEGIMTSLGLGKRQVLNQVTKTL